MSLLTNAKDYLWVDMVAWAKGGEAILFHQPGHYYKGANGRPEIIGSSFWLYDLTARTVRVVLENGSPASWNTSFSALGDLLAVKYRTALGAPWKLAVLSLKTLTLTDINGAGRGAELVWIDGSWDNKADRFAGIARKGPAGGPFVYVLTVYSVAAGEFVAEREMTRVESTAQQFSATWMADGSRLIILDREENALRILGPDLRDLDRIALPAFWRPPFGVMLVGDKALVEGENPDSLWRCDLATKRWKRIY